MKKITYIIGILLGVATMFTACSKDFLETPAPNLSDEVYFSSDAAAESALIGVYSGLNRYQSMQIGEWAIGDIVSDDAEKGGEGPGDMAPIEAMRTFAATGDNEILMFKWTEPYIGISRANTLIEGIEGNELISAATQKLVIAEAKFLRAFYYFQLTKVFGGVPMIITVDLANQTAPRNTLAECYAQMAIDLKAAAANLPDEASVAGRATKGAANALLVKTYIFDEKWADAYTVSQAIIDAGTYDLEPIFEEIFTESHENGIESIFEVQYSHNGSEEWGDGNPGNVTTVFTACRVQEGDGAVSGWGFNCPTQDLYDEFEVGDLRREATFIEDGEILWEGTDYESIVWSNNQYNITGYHNQKSQMPNHYDIGGGGMSQSPNNHILIRFADLLLWNAEAAAHDGKDWATSVNRVRARAGLAATTEADGLTAVYHERRVELAMEGHRYYDLVRTGRGNLMTEGYVATKRFFPIPQREINLNPSLIQNDY